MNDNVISALQEANYPTKEVEDLEVLADFTITGGSRVMDILVVDENWEENIVFLSRQPGKQWVQDEVAI